MSTTSVVLIVVTRSSSTKLLSRRNFYFVAHSNCFQFHHRALLRRPRAYESKHLKSAYGASILRSSSSGNDESTSKTNPSSELEELQNELWLIEAIEARNAAQINSFVDEAAQWEAQSEEDRAQLLRKPAVVAAIQRLEEEQGDREGAAQKQNSSGAQVTANSGSFEHDDEDGNDTGTSSHEVLASICAVSLLLMGNAPEAVAASDGLAFLSTSSNQAEVAVALVFPLLTYKVAAVARGQQLMWYLDASIALVVVAVLRVIFQDATFGASQGLETLF